MQAIKIASRAGRVIEPGWNMPQSDWPVRHLNAGTAGCKQLLPSPGSDLSYYVTGYMLGGGATGDGFHLLRRNCLQFTTTDTWTITDGGATLDIAVAATGHFTIEAWMMIPAASGATNILTRGNPADEGYTFEITAGGLLKFTAKDGANAITATGTTVLNDGEWHYLAVSVTRASATGMILCVDGVTETISTGSASTSAMTQAIAIGCWAAVQTGTSNKTHYLGPLGFYNGASGALSAATMLANYNDGIGRKYHGAETGLALAFNNDEGIGTANHDVKNDSGYVVVNSGVEWVPSKQNGATAAVAVQGAPFEKDGVALDTEMLDAMGKFITCYESADEASMGLTVPQMVNFPHAIKIGRNNPLRILETDGAFDLMLFGFTDKY